MENKKPVIVTIVILLIIFTPLTVISAFIHADRNPLDENPGHDFYYKGKLWFYNSDDKLVSTYECGTETCEFTKPIIDDAEYGINYYKDGTKMSVNIVDDKFTFITDGVVVSLFNVEMGTTLQTYKAVKNYNIDLENNTYIIKNNSDLWGALTIGDNLSSVLPFEYDFIGIKDGDFENGRLNIKEFIVLKNSKWFLVDTSNNVLTEKVNNPIVNYNKNYLFTKTSDRYRIFGYDGVEYLSNYRIKNYVIEDNYYGIITDSFVLVYNNLGSNYLKVIPITSQVSKVELEKRNNNLAVKFDGNTVDNIAIVN